MSASYTFVPFTSLHDRPGLISLEAARNSPEIKSPKITVVPVPKTNYPCKLISLAEANARDDIKRYREEYEAKETRRQHMIRAAEWAADDELNFRCYYC
ncbi:hypothetical protein EIP86_008620 [Pleurotus ostreatoroseus]|nr:hypothetical protein EIP86_008620 [Pleurotus ostreatoroseus]